MGNKSNNSSYLLGKPGKNYSGCYSTKYTDVNMDFSKSLFHRLSIDLFAFKT